MINQNNANQPAVRTETSRVSVHTILNDITKVLNKEYTITYFADHFGVKRRRIYDIVNVLVSIGCCTKSGLDHFTWLGVDPIPSRIEALRTIRKIDDPSIPLRDLFNSNNTVGISNLTMCLILLFLSIKNDHLDLRFVGQLFSRGSTRYKTTLCKLYQITTVLNEIGVTSRTSQVCEVVLNRPYYTGEVIEAISFSHDDPSSISSLLNRPIVPKNNEYIISRRKELRDLFIEGIASKTVGINSHSV